MFAESADDFAHFEQRQNKQRSKTESPAKLTDSEGMYTDIPDMVHIQVLQLKAFHLITRNFCGSCFFEKKKSKKNSGKIEITFVKKCEAHIHENFGR